MRLLGLGEVLKFKRLANIEKGLAESPRAPVIIVADALSNTEPLIEVMDQSRLAGAENISVATDEL